MLDYILLFESARRQSRRQSTPTPRQLPTPMNPVEALLNPNGPLNEEVARRLWKARKSKPLWAKRLQEAQSVQTLEGLLHAEAGDYLCRGVNGELWPQKAVKLLEKYLPTESFDNGWQCFNPKPDSEGVEATQVDHAFRIQAHWGILNGKAGDYVVRSRTDSTDVWIVDKAIFEATYQRESA